MKTSFNLLVLALGLSTASIAVADGSVLRAADGPMPNEFNCADKHKTYVVYGNGMFTSVEKARDNMYRLMFSMNEHGVKEAIEPGTKDVHVCIAYNFNEPAARQLGQVLWQKLKDTALVNTAGKQANARNLVSWFVSDSLEQKIFGRVQDETAKFYRENLVADRDLRLHIATYRGLLAQGARVVLVSHSQGNFYSNAAFSGLSTDERKRFGQVMVASPTKSVLSGGPQTTLNVDLVMQGVRIAFPHDTLPSNYDTLPTLREWMGHGFEEAYLQNPGVCAKIMQDIIDTARKLENKANAAAPLKITLSGTGNGQYSLYVYEPNGRQVYFQDRSGDEGVWSTKDGVDTYVTNGPVGAGKLFNIAVFYTGPDREPGDATVKLEAGGWSHYGTIHFSEPEPIGNMEHPRQWGWVKASTEDGNKGFEVKEHGN